MLFASCGNGDNALEEIINGGGSGGGSSTTENKYYVWNGTDLEATDIPTDAKEVTTATTKFEGGTYIVKGDVTCSAINVTADSKLILCDDAKLTVTGHIEDETGGGTLSLSIYGQKNQTGKLVITGEGTNGLWAKDIEIHGGDISITITTGTMPLSAIKTDNNLSIYGGKIIATGADADASNAGGHGIDCGINLAINGKAVVKSYGGAKSGSWNGGHGIIVNGNLAISDDADVYAKAGEDATAAIEVKKDLTFSGKQLVTESTGASAGLETEAGEGGSITISLGTVAITTAGGPAIQSDKDVDITAGVTKVELTNSSVSGTGTDNPQHFIDFTGSLTLGGTNVTAVWTGGDISDVTTATPLTYAEKTLTYQP